MGDGQVHVQVLGQRAVLDTGNEVTVARRPEAVPERPGLTVVAGDATDAVALTAGLKGAEAVVTAVGVSGLLAARKGTTVYSGGARALLEAVAGAEVDRVVAVTSGGVVPQPGDGWFYRTVLKRFFLEPLHRDVRVMEQLLRESSVAWTVVRPSFLVGDARRTDYRISVDEPVPDDRTLSRWSLAHLLLAEATSREHVGRIVAVSY
ncbi:NAD(P)-dependent oxidoreductase [Geodermatophilus sp. SYSU D00684]